VHPTFTGTVHVYRDADGNPTHGGNNCHCRKQFRPRTYGTLDGVPGWHCKHAGTPRPLYGLDRLAARPGAPVIVCEGEKAADAAATIFADHVCVSWPGGTGAVAVADFGPLIKCDVILWPDNDGPGLKAGAEIARLLPAARTRRVDDLPAGADAADVGAPWDAFRMADRRIADHRISSGDGRSLAGTECLPGRQLDPRRS
jgi:putative DNA primase/helicase